MRKTHTFAMLAALLIAYSPSRADTCPTARGGATLAVLRPGFPIKPTIDMLSAAAPHPAIGVVHKAFGSNYANLREVINGLINHPTRPSTCVSVVLYVECGPCRTPRRPAGMFPVIAPHLSIPALNSNLERAHIPTLKAFDKELERIEGALPQLPGVRYILEPGLEDNFTTPAFRALQSLIEQRFQGRPDYTIARNRIDNRDVPRPLNKEIHTYDYREVSKLKAGDIISGDGYTLCLPTDQDCKGYSMAQVGRLLREASERGVIVLLWRPEWQGLPAQIPGHVQSPVPPSKRKYTLAGRGYIKKLLRR